MNEKTEELLNKVNNLFKEYFKEKIEGDILRDEINKSLDNIEDWINDSKS